MVPSLLLKEALRERAGATRLRFLAGGSRRTQAAELASSANGSTAGTTFPTRMLAVGFAEQRTTESKSAKPKVVDSRSLTKPRFRGEEMAVDPKMQILLPLSLLPVHHQRH